jgi:hypothetical protein
MADTGRHFHEAGVLLLPWLLEMTDIDSLYLHRRMMILPLDDELPNKGPFAVGIDRPVNALEAATRKVRIGVNQPNDSTARLPYEAFENVKSAATPEHRSIARFVSSLRASTPSVSEARAEPGISLVLLINQCDT